MTSLKPLSNKIILILVITTFVYVLSPGVSELVRRRAERRIVNEYDSSIMTQEEIDWYSGKTKPGPGVFAAHPLSEYK